MTDENKAIADANRHVAQLEERIAQQRQRIAECRAQGKDTALNEKLLALDIDVLVAAKRHRDFILNYLEWQKRQQNRLSPGDQPSGSNPDKD